jgi:uncharacterized protein YndB with AHSA1/START domain
MLLDLTEATMRFTNTITIQRRVPELFAFLAQFENIPRWNYAISRTWAETAGPVGPGSRYTQHRTVPKTGEESFEVTEYQPDRYLAIKGRFAGLPTEAAYELEAIGDATRLTNVMQIEPEGLLGLVAPVAAPRLKAAVAHNLERLKDILEGADA